MASISAGSSATVGFNAARWLGEWTAHGGIYILIGDRLHLRRLTPLDPAWSKHLDRLRTEMLRSGGGVALALHLLQQREGNLG